MASRFHSANRAAKTRSFARAINRPGQVVGWAGDADGAIRPVLWDNGEAVLLDSRLSAAAKQGRAYGINDAGDIVGHATPDAYAPRAMVWRGGVLTDLGTLPGHPNSTAIAINDAGQMVGWSGSYDAGEGSAVMWEGGEIVALADPAVAVAAPAGPVVIEAFDSLEFDPAVVVVAPGHEGIVINAGVLEHDLVVDEWQLATDLLSGGEQQAITVPADVPVGSIANFYCSVPGHREAGMEGVFIVGEPAP